MADTTQPLLEIVGLCVELDSAGETRRVLDDINITVMPGEPMGLVGESGSGKSMTLRTILGLLPSNARVVSGEVRFRGEDVLRSGPRAGYRSAVRGAGISMVFQEPGVALNPVMSIGRQLTDAVKERRGLTTRQADELAVDLLTRVGIVEPERRVSNYPFELSGGMRQRVMIAAAIASEPDLLLCDEPTTALDVTIQAQIVDLFRSLQSGLGLLYVTHDLAVVAQLCTQITVMRYGKVVEAGPLQRVFDDPQDAYTQKLLAATPRIPEEVR